MTVETGQSGRSQGPGCAPPPAARNPREIGSSVQTRLQRLACLSPSSRRLVDDLLAVAGLGLPRMHKDGVFAHTMRFRDASPRGTGRQGDNLRYAAMVALGLSKADEGIQRQVLGFGTAADLAKLTAERAEGSVDDGAVALAAWAAAEAGHIHPAALLRRLAGRLASDIPISTVICSWALIAALAARGLGNMWDVAGPAHKRLLAARAGSGLFRSAAPASAAGRLRAHIGCFADQVYPIMALARLHAALGDPDALDMAEGCARLICGRQGPEGQWWWHYDTRTGRVAEGFPVYSVHQHAMAPMALLELHEAGGSDYLREIARGLDWLESHPETKSTLIDRAEGVIWRKVYRREPRKAARALAAVATTISPLLHVPGLDIVFPPGRIDHECRPYELGWLLYAWLSKGLARGNANARAGHADAIAGEA